MTKYLQIRDNNSCGNNYASLLVNLRDVLEYYTHVTVCVEHLPGPERVVLSERTSLAWMSAGGLPAWPLQPRLFLG